jgi:hypothetical protein
VKQNATQHGFSALIVFIIILTIVGLGFTSWYVWNKNKPSDLTRRMQSTTTPMENTDKQQSSPNEDKYLVVKEWGVKIPLSENISEAYYEFNTDELAEYVSLYDAAFNRLKNTNGVSCGGKNTYQFYSISRTKPENVEALSEDTGPSYEEFPFTDRYLFGGLGAHQAPPTCADLNSNPNGEFQEDHSILNIARTKEQAFNNAFKRLQLK